MNGRPYWRLLFTYETELWLSLWLYVSRANNRPISLRPNLARFCIYSSKWKTSTVGVVEIDLGTGRITLTKAHLELPSGKKLVEIILYIGIDGEISDADLHKLAQWLKNEPIAIPAVRHLRELIADALRDGFISEDERSILHKQIERILPPSERARLILARKEILGKKGRPKLRRNN